MLCRKLSKSLRDRDERLIPAFFYDRNPAFQSVVASIQRHFDWAVRNSEWIVPASLDRPHEHESQSVDLSDDLAVLMPPPLQTSQFVATPVFAALTRRHSPSSTERERARSPRAASTSYYLRYYFYACMIVLVVVIGWILRSYRKRLH